MTKDTLAEVALDAFRLGPPGVIRRMVQNDSYPGEYPGDPDAYKEIPTTRLDELDAMRRVIDAIKEQA